jgi:hypothetical protein
MAGELAGDRDSDDRSSLATTLERVPAYVQPASARIGTRRDDRRLSLPPTLERCARAWRSALVPGSLDEQASSMRVAGLRDRALPATLTRGVLARHEPEEGPKRMGAEALPVAELDAQGQRGQGGDAAQAD